MSATHLPRNGGRTVILSIFGRFGAGSVPRRRRRAPPWHLAIFYISFLGQGPHTNRLKIRHLLHRNEIHRICPPTLFVAEPLLYGLYRCEKVRDGCCSCARQKRHHELCHFGIVQNISGLDLHTDLALQIHQFLQDGPAHGSLAACPYVQYGIVGIHATLLPAANRDGTCRRVPSLATGIWQCKVGQLPNPPVWLGVSPTPTRDAICRIRAAGSLGTDRIGQANCSSAPCLIHPPKWMLFTHCTKLEID